MAEILFSFGVYLIIAIVAGLVAGYFVSKRSSSVKLAGELQQHEKQISNLIQDGFQRNVDSVVTALLKSSSTITTSLGDMRQHLGEISSMSDKVDVLHKIISNPSARGAFGEQQLQDIVKDMLPVSMYEFQCELSNGRRVDCLITPPPPSGSIPIDAKFPLANFPGAIAQEELPNIDRWRRTFARDVKKHLEDIANRYIHTGETSEYAMMFVPSEAVFSEIYEYHQDIVQLSQEKRVYIVSPTTMMATVMAIRGVIKDAAVNEKANLIHSELIKLTKQIGDLVDSLTLTQKHIRNADNSLSGAVTSARKLGDNLDYIQDLDFDGEELPDTRVDDR